jgi:hypothetical protein
MRYCPPNYLYTITYAQSPLEHGPMMPEIAGYYSGFDREWFRPIREGDKFTYRVICPSENIVKASLSNLHCVGRMSQQKVFC